MANINKIRLSGQTYNIEDENATKTVELTQAQYDALTVKDPNTFYIITDAQGGDLSNYYTKTEVDNAITAATSTKQDTLVSGTNIKTINNTSILGSGNIDIQGGGGGGKAIEAGRGISITTGDTADTVSFNLPISAGTGTDSIVVSDNARASGNKSFAFGGGKAEGNYSFACGDRDGTYFATASGMGSVAFNRSNAIGRLSFACGNNNSASTASSFACGYGTITRNEFEFSCGQANISVSASTTFGDSGNTLFSIGNGLMYYNNHNAFEIRQNGDIYIADTNDTSTTDYKQKPMIKLQDALGGGGLSLVKLTQAEYNALATIDDNTVYFIGDSTNGYTMKIGSANVN